MAISNAHHWVSICDQQLAIFDKLAEHFPERKQHLAELALGWRQVQSQLKLGQVPRVASIKSML